jgi:hypothetical protein
MARLPFTSGTTTTTPGGAVPAGGTTGQVLKKLSGTDYATEWADDETTAGAATSVVVLNELYVSTTGDIYGDGSATDPVSTLELAVSFAVGLSPSATNPIVIRLGKGNFVSNENISVPAWVYIVGPGMDMCEVAMASTYKITVAGAHVGFAGWHLTRDGSDTGAVLTTTTSDSPYTWLDDVLFKDFRCSNSNGTAVATLSAKTTGCIFDDSVKAVDYNYGGQHFGSKFQGSQYAVYESQSHAPLSDSPPANVHMASFDPACLLISTAPTGGWTIYGLVESQTAQRTAAQRTGVNWYATTLNGTRIYGASVSSTDPFPATPATSPCVLGCFQALSPFIYGDVVTTYLFDSYFTSGYITSQRPTSTAFLTGMVNVQFTGCNFIFSGSTQKFTGTSNTHFNACSFEGDSLGYFGTMQHASLDCKDSTNGLIGWQRNDLALRFSGNVGCWAQIPASTNYNFSTSGTGMTIEFWMRSSDTSATGGIMANYHSATGWALFTEPVNGKITLRCNTADLVKTSSGCFNGSWHHVAIILSGTSRRIVIDGDYTGAVSDTNGVTTSNNSRVLLGGYTANGTNDTDGDSGYMLIGDLRQVIIWRCVRYTADFDPRKRNVADGNMLAFFGERTVAPRAANGEVYWQDMTGCADAKLGMASSPTVRPLWISEDYGGTHTGEGTPGVGMPAAVRYDPVTNTVKFPADGITFPGTVTATAFSGSGASLTSVNAATFSTAAESSDTSCFPVFVTASGTQTLAGKTNTAFTFNSATSTLGATSGAFTQLLDTNGNELFKFTATASAVNEITVTNGGAGTSGAVSLSATGGDTDIDLHLVSKGGGGVDIMAGAAELVSFGATEATFGIPVNATGFAVTGAAGSFTTLAASGTITSTDAVAASAPIFYATGALYTGGTGTTTFPAVFHQPTGTTATTTFSSGANSGTVFGANEASGFVGNFLDFRIAGTNATGTNLPVAALAYDGKLKFYGNSGSNVGFVGPGNQSLVLGTGTAATVGVTSAAVNLARDMALNWSTSTTNVATTSDTTLSRVSAGLVGFGTGTAAEIDGSWSALNGTLGGTLAVTGATTLTGNLTSNGAYISTPQALSGNGAVAAVSVATEVTTIANTGTANTTTTLAAGTNGQKKVISFITDGGFDAVITVTNPAWGGAGTITMNDALDNIELRYLNSVWQVFINNGCTLA